MKKFWVSLLAIFLTLGQAPAWAMVCGPRCMPQASLACVRACARSKALLTHNGTLPSLGQSCGQVATRFAQPALAVLTAPSLVLPSATFSVPVAAVLSPSALFTVQAQAHAPPCALAAQAILSVPVAQAPPVLILSV